MDLPLLFSALGGQRAVARRLGVGRSAVAMWAHRGAVPPEHHLPLWQAAIEAGLSWEPPNAEGLLDALKARMAGASAA